MNEKDIATIFKAFCDENRIRILQLLLDGEKCACRLLEEMNITQPTLSHHMKVLEKEGLVRVTKKGKWHHYSLNQDTAALLINGLSKTLSNTEDCICNDKNKKC